MPRLDRLPEGNRKNLLALAVRVNATSPFTRLRRALADCRVALVTTAGLHRRGDRPFGPGDQEFREIPSDTPSVDLVQSHTSLGFDRVPIMRDVNVTFPIDRLAELVERGEVGALAPLHYSFMGALRDLARLEAETGPAVGRALHEAGVDAALITPT
jgi:D-proline reductase (dithiol) PrdB